MLVSGCAADSFTATKRKPTLTAAAKATRHSCRKQYIVKARGELKRGAKSPLERRFHLANPDDLSQPRMKSSERASSKERSATGNTKIYKSKVVKEFDAALLQNDLVPQSKISYEQFKLILNFMSMVRLSSSYKA